MIKISNLFLLVFLIGNLTLVEGMVNNALEPKFHPLATQLSNALYAKDFDAFKQLVENNKIDINQLANEQFTIFGNVIRKYLDGTVDIKLIEYLLQHGADINSIVEQNVMSKHTALQYILYWYDLYLGIWLLEQRFQLTETTMDDNRYLNLIRLLLAYGARIDEESLNMVKNMSLESNNLDSFYTKILQVFNHYINRVEQAKTNPSEELLLEAIGYNKPYIVKLIVESKPELVTHEFIKLARINSPASVPLLEKVFKLQQFVETARENLPSELIDRIGRFALKN